MFLTAVVLFLLSSFKQGLPFGVRPAHPFRSPHRPNCLSICKDRYHHHSSSRVQLRTDEEDDEFDDDFKDLIDGKIERRFRKDGQQRKPKKPKGKRDESDVDDDVPVLFNGLNKWEVFNKAIFAGIFVAGIGTGITIDSAINTNPKDLASRDAIDRNAPNPRLCATYGSSAMVLDQRVFVTFNPFNVYVTQADTKPGCVLRPSNVVEQLQKRRDLLADADIEGCKNGFNTWAFIGDINNKPQLNCVFQSDDAQNEFLSTNPKIGLGEDIYDKASSANPLNPGPGSIGAIKKFSSTKEPLIPSEP